MVTPTHRGPHRKYRALLARRGRR